MSRIRPLTPNELEKLRTFATREVKSQAGLAVFRTSLDALGRKRIPLRDAYRVVGEELERVGRQYREAALTPEEANA